MMRRRHLTILGATGSIGQSTLDVVARDPERFRVVALTASSQARELAELCARHHARYACIANADQAPQLEECLRQLGATARVLAGADGLSECASLPEVDCVMAAIVGSAGLLPTLAAASAGKTLLLANKEALVMAGPIFMDTVQASGASLLPIDSEHNAVFQCLPPGFRPGEFPLKGIRRILLTGSGGPFRDRPRDELGDVTPAQACAHPNWVMGRKISVDSATMMNKGLEVIEAHWLFGADPSCIEVVVHPQSVIHSMVEYADGSVIAQMGNPDMRTPIAQALAYPDRIDAGVASLDLFRVGTLTFQAPDPARFPALPLAHAALRAGGTAPAILNAANEIAVASFLAGRLSYLHITDVIAETLDRVSARPLRSLDDALDADQTARVRAADVIGRLGMRAA